MLNSTTYSRNAGTCLRNNNMKIKIDAIHLHHISEITNAPMEYLNCKSDIDKVLRGLDNVISYHNVASSEDQDIRDGLVFPFCY